MNLSFPLSFLVIVSLVIGTALRAQDRERSPDERAPVPQTGPEAAPGTVSSPTDEAEGEEPRSTPSPADPEEKVDGEDDEASESPPTGDAEAFAVPEQMAVFSGHVGRWKGLTKTAITENGSETITRTRSEWTGGYLLGGHAFEMRGYSYGTLGRTEYRWQYTYDALKERYMAAYYDSHGRTYFCEGKINQENTKIIWRLLAPPGDMSWHAETDLQPENGIETNGQIKSEKFDYDMVYSSVFRRS